MQPQVNFILCISFVTYLAIAGQHLHSLLEHTETVRAVAAIGAGQLANGGNDGTIKIWVCAAIKLPCSLPWVIPNGALVQLLGCFGVRFAICGVNVGQDL